MYFKRKRKLNHAVNRLRKSHFHHELRDCQSPIVKREIRRLRLGGETQLGTVGAEDDVLALQEDVTEDGHANVRVVLNTTEAGGAAVGNGGVVDEIARDNGLVVTDGDSEVGEAGAAREHISSVLLVVLSAVDLLVVGLDGIAGEQEQSGTGV